ncbi:MAG TPA: hypothetical protein VJ747_10120 [Stellaceae bacterium]|nr:hypothetical protein [Stellaceae bacterium]
MIPEGNHRAHHAGVFSAASTGSLFVLARRANDKGRADRLWQPGRHR